MKHLILLFCLLFPRVITAQLFVDTMAYSAEELVLDFFQGHCVDVLSVDFKGHSAQKTFFEGSQSGINVNAGIILATGQADVAVGPNDNSGASRGYGTAFQPDGSPFSQFLQDAAVGQAFDPCLLHIKLIPRTDSIGFKYVFASEEYCEYVGTQYNDIFGFLIAGPGLNGVENIARTPGSGSPVSINNVNHLINPGYYRHNVADTNLISCGLPLSTDPMAQWVQFDGMTTVLEAGIRVLPDSVYDVWIGIVDVSDAAWDSGIFLSIESLCGDSLLSPVAALQAVTNGNTVTFNNATKYATAWHWAFGDGAYSNERNPTHTYDDLATNTYTVQLIAANYCCTDTFLTTVGATTADFELREAACRVFPTRFTDQLTVMPGGPIDGRLTLRNMTGKMVLEKAITGPVNLETGFLPAGTYLLEITAGNGNHWTFRLLK